MRKMYLVLLVLGLAPTQRKRKKIKTKFSHPKNFYKCFQLCGNNLDCCDMYRIERQTTQPKAERRKEDSHVERAPTALPHKTPFRKHSEIARLLSISSWLTSAL